MDPKVRAALRRLQAMDGTPIAEYRDAVTQELCALTGSDLSYFAAMNADESILTMIGWSRSAMQSCGIMDKPIVYKLEDTGLWGDAVRERGPVITNDYQDSIKATKRGYPQGHVHVENHMNLPIFEGDRVALVVGVGNKPGGYTMDDVALVEELMNEAWHTFRRALWEASW